MKVSLEWLKEWIEVRQTAQELADTLTNGGIEVGSIDNLNEGLEQVVIGEICELQKLPNSEKLWICQVNTGKESLSIVTGAQNLQIGDKVPIALAGAKLPNGLEIQTSKLRGVLSEGMLCSAEELHLDISLGQVRSAGGIMILAQDSPLGQNLAEFLGLSDYVLDLELYPNRPDCLAMVNVAREVASLTGEKTHLPKWADLDWHPDLPVALDVKIVLDEPDLCWRYSGLVVEDVKIAPSPEWMKRRLRAAGVRSISNIVDITNYVMLEMGQPLHAFDRDKISGAVHVRRARTGEKLITLDHVERTLDPEMLLIADDEQALGLAGVMGGLDSEITENTHRLFVESAYFSPVSIRRTSRRLGLRSEAANRFEKGVNAYGCLAVLGRVSELLIELKAGRPVSIADKIHHLPLQNKITFSPDRTSTILGVEVTEADIRWVLKRLGFAYQAEGSGFRVEIPSYRTDLQIEEDLIEEVARLIGYDRIPTTLPQGSQTQGRRTPEQEFRRRLRTALARVGMNEVSTYSFTNAGVNEQWGNAAHAIALLNPLREELGVMRTTLLPGLLEVAGRNLARRNMDISIFEIGNIYQAEDSVRPLRQLPRETLKVAGLAVGKSKRHWFSQSPTYDFYYLKGILEEVAREFGLSLGFRLAGEQKLLHPGRSAEVYIGETKVGIIGEIHPALEREWGLERAVLFELEVTPLLEHGQQVTRTQPIPRFPAVQRDLAVIVDKDVPAAKVMERIREAGGELLQQVEVFDVYTGKSIPNDRRSLAFNLRYQSLERTLTDEEVNAFHTRILEGIQQEFAAESRK
ncbi:MAG: phenylalanine--tRNA ligase subunit beta [Desulfitobacteriaceae bacterium]